MTISATLTPLEDHKVRLDVAVPEDEVRQRAARAVQDIGRGIRLPGFRPGKAPAAMIVKTVGRDAVIERMLRDSLTAWYEQALASTGVEPIDEPEVDLPEATDEGPINFSATVMRRPTATLGEYKNLEVVRQQLPDRDAVIEEEIERMRVQAARLEDTDRAAQAGDYITMDFDGSMDGEPLESATGRDYVVELGAGRLVAGFDEALYGAKTGDAREFDLAYPEADQRDELKGKTLHFSVTLKGVQERVPPPLDDAFASDAAGFENLAELRTDVGERVDAALKQRSDEQFRRSAIDGAVANATVDIPAVMVDRRVEAILHDMAHRLPEGIGLQAYLEAQGSSLEKARKDMRIDADLSIRRELVIEAVAAAEGIEVTDADIEARVETDATAAERDPKAVMKALRSTGNIDVVREDMARDLATAIITDSAVELTEGEADAKERLWKPNEPTAAAGAGEIWTPDKAEPKKKKAPAKKSTQAEG
jgi:trigger factor